MCLRLLLSTIVHSSTAAGVATGPCAGSGLVVGVECINAERSSSYHHSGDTAHVHVAVVGSNQ